MKPEYYRQLDGVRAIAALMVMFFHFFVLIHSDQGIFHVINKIAVLGQTGVSLFFVLSGFLITRILLATKRSPNYFADFYIRRSLRIFPLYYFFLTLYYFIIPFIQHVPSVPWSHQFYFWVYLQNFALYLHWPQTGPAHLWSLAIEEHFYLLWPCIVYFFDKKGIKSAVVITQAIAFGCCLLLLQKRYNLVSFTFSHIGVILSGALLAVWESEGKLKKYAPRFISGAGILLIPFLFLWATGIGKAFAVIGYVKFNLLAWCYFCLVGFVVTRKQNNAINKLLTSRLLTFTGKISYGLYIYHPLCFGLLLNAMPSASLFQRLFLCVAVSYLVSTASFYLFEARFILLKKYFAYDWRRENSQTLKAEPQAPELDIPQEKSDYNILS